LSYKPRGGHSYGNNKRGRSGSRFGSGKGHAKYDSQLARRDFEGRSKLSQKLDLHRFAKVTTDIIAYLHSPTELDWQGVDDPASLAKFAEKKGSAHIVVKEEKGNKTHHFKVKKKTEDKKETEKVGLAKSENTNPILEKPTHKLPSEKEILEHAQQLYMKDNGRRDYQEGVGTNLPERTELKEEGYLQKAKLDLMTSEDTQASRATFDYIDNLRGQLEKIGFTIEPIQGFSSEDLQY
jgi:hypothetical protein